jgi:hypothetical protein
VTGSRHARRLLVEAGWHYRRAPATGQALKRRQEGQRAHVVEIAWQAQRRLHRVWQRLDSQRGKRPHDRRGRRRAGLRGFLLGTGERRLTPRCTTSAEEAAGTTGHTRESIRDLRLPVEGGGREVDGGELGFVIVIPRP